MKKPKFRVGDKVKAFGVEGVVEKILNGGDYPITIRFKSGNMDYPGSVTFTANGKFAVWAKIISLKLIERPKKKKKITVWVGIGELGDTREFYRNSFAYLDKDWPTTKNYPWKYGVHPIEIWVDDE